MLKAVRSFLRRVIGSDRHGQVRYVAATGAERRLAHRRYLDRQLELAVAVCTLTDDQKIEARKRAELGFVPRAEKRSAA